MLKSRRPIRPSSAAASAAGTLRPARPASAGEERSRGRRRWWFPLAAMFGVTALLLAAVEGVLRLAGFGYPTHFFLKTRQGDRTVMTENPRFGWRYMPPMLARSPVPLSFAPHKPAGTCRIFLLGESAAMGDPEPAFGVARVVQALLEARFPERRFETINTATTAIDSCLIRDLARDCAGYEGDFWVVYMGNNEVVGPFGPATALGARTHNPLVMRAGLAVKRTRLGQALAALVQAVRGSPEGSRTWGGMEMFEGQTVRLGDPALQPAYRQFRGNLLDILQQARSHGVKVIVSTLACNDRDCPPFASSPSPKLTGVARKQWDGAYRAGCEAIRAGQVTNAIAAFRQALELDSGDAELHFRLGRCLLASGEKTEARARFVAARDLDQLRFRADSRYNLILRESASQRESEGVYLVDSAQFFAAQSRGNVTGSEHFFEHVHFRFEGTYLLGLVLAQRIAGLLPPEPGTTGQGRWLSQADCARRLGVNAWARYHVIEAMRARLNRPPFNRQFTHAERDRELGEEMAQLRPGTEADAFAPQEEFYRKALAGAPDDWMLRDQYAKFLEGFGRSTEAIEQWRQVLEQVPHYAGGQFLLGMAYQRAGSLNAAVRHLAEAARLKWNFHEAYHGLGLALTDQREYAAAGKAFAQALRIQPQFVEARLGWGRALGEAGRADEAVRQFAEAARTQPQSAQVHYRWGLELERQGQPAQAQTQYVEALRLQSNAPLARLHLGMVLAQQAQWTQAVAQFEETLRLQPTNALAREHLERVRKQLTAPPSSP